MQWNQLHKALVSAFPDVASLHWFVKTELDKSLYEITGGTSIDEMIFDLIVWAEYNNGTKELVKKACQSNPNNQYLKDCYLSIFGDEHQQAPLSIQSVPLSVAMPQHAPMTANYLIVNYLIFLIFAIMVIVLSILVSSGGANGRAISSVINMPNGLMQQNHWTPMSILTPLCSLLLGYFITAGFSAIKAVNKYYLLKRTLDRHFLPHTESK